MMGFNKNSNDQQSNQNPPNQNPQQNQNNSQNFLGNLQNNQLMNFGMSGHQMNPSFESETFNYGSMGQVIFYHKSTNRIKIKIVRILYIKTM